MKTETLIESIEDAYKSIPRYSLGNGMYNFNSIAEYGKACIKHGANWQKDKDKAVNDSLLNALKDVKNDLDYNQQQGKTIYGLVVEAIKKATE